MADMDDWDRFIPRMDDYSHVYCINVKAFLSVGTFVLVSTADSENASSAAAVQAGCILEIESDTDRISLNHFKREQSNVASSDAATRHIPRLKQSKETKWYKADEVQTIAFVFKEAEFLRIIASAQGMRNLFFLEEKRDDGSQVPESDCLPFPSSYHPYLLRLPDCYPSRIWNSLDHIRAELSRLLGRYSQKQGAFSSARSQISLSKETWEYIVKFVEGVTEPPRCHNAKRCRRVLEPGLHLRSLRVSYSCQMLRFSTRDEIRALRQLLGELTCIEVRKRRPAIADPQRLRQNDSVNVVVGAEYRPADFRFRTTDDGVDLSFDGIDKMQISIRYRGYIYKTQGIAGAPKDCPSTALKRAIQYEVMLSASSEEESDNDSTDDDEENENPFLARIVDQEFEKDGRLYRVQSLAPSGLELSAKCLYPSANRGEVDIFTVEHVTELIKDRLK